MGGLEQAVGIPDLRARRHTHSADQTAREIREDVAEHVLHDQHVELPRLSDQIESLGVDVII